MCGGGHISPPGPSIPPAMKIQQRVVYAAAAVAQIRRYIKSNENKSSQKIGKFVQSCSIYHKVHIFWEDNIFLYLELHK